MTTSDGDFLHVDRLGSQSNRLAILCHGLEGSSLSKYIIGTGSILHQRGWDIAAINYRGCSGTMNKNVRLYHSGATDDIHEVVQQLGTSYDEIALVGFSLGGNLVLKYVGENIYPSVRDVMSIVAISVPVDLEAASRQISKKSNFIYEKKFLKSLRIKVKDKSNQFPELVDLTHINSIKSLFEFDDVYTANLHGFKNAVDYYNKSNSKQFLKDIKVPTLIVNALDDPFLPKPCYPLEEVNKNPWITLLTPKYGGHVGFVSEASTYYWEEKVIHQYLNEISSF